MAEKLGIVLDLLGEGFKILTPGSSSGEDSAPKHPVIGYGLGKAELEA